MCKERKIVWVYPTENKMHCPVRLVEKYMNLCPAVSVKMKKLNFYLRTLEKPTPVQWYGEQVVGLNTIRKVVGNLLKSANLDGFFTNHSLRHSGTSRLFQSGIDKKIIKEYTGHHSNALHAYETNSNEQRKELSNVISGELHVDKKQKSESIDIPKYNFEFSVVENASNKCMGCSCSKREIRVDEAEKIGEMIKQIIEGKARAKATIKLEIKFDH